MIDRPGFRGSFDGLVPVSMPLLRLTVNEVWGGTSSGDGNGSEDGDSSENGDRPVITITLLRRFATSYEFDSNLRVVIKKKYA